MNSSFTYRRQIVYPVMVVVLCLLAAVSPLLAAPADPFTSAAQPFDAPPPDAVRSPLAEERAAADTPELLVLDTFDEWTVGGGYLYWATHCFSPNPELAEQPRSPSSHYALHRWPLAGGSPETLMTAGHANCNTFRFLAADGDGVFFWDDSLARLMHYPADRAPGLNPTIVRENVNSDPIGLYLDDDYIYYPYAIGRIRRVAKNGGASVLIHNTGSGIASMAVDRGRNDLYWIDGNGLWYGRKTCASPPCAKAQLTSATGSHIALGATGLVPRTVYMVRTEASGRAIRSYTCAQLPCISQAWSTGTPLSSNIGLPAWTATGFIQPTEWLVWPEWSGSGGRLVQRELDPAENPYTRSPDHPEISLKVIAAGGQIYFASMEAGNERIMRLPVDGQPAPRDFGNLAPIDNPAQVDQWKPVVRVESKWDERPDNTTLCTGTLIDPGFVITAAACIYDGSPNNFGYASSVRVVPAYANGAEPFGDAQAQEMWVFDTFNDTLADWEHDIGWIKLDRPVGALTRWYQIGWQEDYFLWLSTFDNPGYPRTGFDGERLHNRSGHFNRMNDGGLFHTAEYANIKGSPALNLAGNTLYGIEVRRFQNQGETVYARLTQAKVQEIDGVIAGNVPTTVDLVPLQFRVSAQGGLAAGTWPASASFVLHNYSTASTPADQTVALRIYLSGDDAIDTTDTLLATGSFQIQGSLDGRRNVDVSAIDWAGAPAIPLDTPPGDYWLGIMLDAADAVPANNATHGWDAMPIRILPPQMSATPGVLTANAAVGDPPIEETVMVEILGNGTGNPDFNWTATTGAAWLSLDPTSGGDGREVTMTIDNAGLDPGIYHGQVNFATVLEDSSGVPVASAAVDVTLNLGVGEAVWQPEPAEMHFEAVAGGADPPTQALVVKATVDYPFNWLVEDGSAVTDDAPWLPANSGAGTAPGLFNVAPDISGLAPGQYSTQLAIHSPGLDNYALTTVNLTVHEAGTPQPLLQLSPATLYFAATTGRPDPGPQTFAIANIGSGQLNWTASSDVAWLSLNPNSGSGDATVSASVSLAGLAPGTHVGQITVAGAAGSQQVVRAVLQLQAPPRMVVDGDFLVFSGLSGQASPAPASFSVRNGGSGSFDWAAAESLGWLQVNPAQGVAPAAVAVQPDTAGLAPGAQQGNITISSPTALDSPQQIDVRLFLRQGPVLAAAPQVLSFSVAAGQPSGVPKPITVENVSHGRLNWTAESDAPWLSLSQPAGTIDAFSSTAVEVSVDAAGLSPRDEAYTGQITIRSGNGEGAPQTIAVFLNVTSPARFCNIADRSEGYAVNSRNAKIRFTNVRRTLTADGGCDLSATLRADLPQNAALQSDVAGHVDSNNVFIPTSASPLSLNIAIFTLQLTDNFSISDEFGLKALGGQWKLPSKFGGKTKNFAGAIQIDAGGISLTGEGKFDLPDIDYGATRFRSLKGEVSVAADRSYGVALTGDMEIGIVGSGTSIEDVELRLDQRGFRSGRIGAFTVKDIAGVDIEVVSAAFDGDKIRAERAILKIPALWGGAEGALYGLQIDFDGDLTVTGGRFKLPAISAGGDSFKLSSLEGEFRSVPGGYEIQARGEFGMRGIGESGGCTLIVDVTIFSDNGTSVLVIRSTEATAGIGLRELTLGVWDCQPGLPIGPTGFELTGVQGTIKLRATLEEVSLKVQIQSIARLGAIPLVSVEPRATLRPDPFFLGYEGPTFLTNMKISDTIGKLENRRFSAEMVFDFVVLHGGLGIEAGLSNGDFFLGGNGWADVSVKKGSVFRECKLGLCVNIPPFSLTVAKAEAKVNLSYVFGSIEVMGYGVGFKYSFQTGDFDLSRALRSRAISSQEIRQVRAYQRSQAGPLPDNHAHVTFAGDESVLLTLPIESPAPHVDRRNAVAARLAAAVQSDALFVLVQPVDGGLTFVLIDPDGKEYTPANLPPNIQFEQAIVDGAQQTVYSVAQARPGNWQTRVEGDVNGTDFAVFDAVNVAAGVLDNLSLAPTGKPNEVKVQWQYLAQQATPRIKLYANAQSITQTVAYTNGHGVLVTGVTDRFAGEPVAEFANPATDGSLQSAVVDLSRLPSDSYAFWIEAEGTDAPGVRCYIRQGGVCGGSQTPVVRFAVDHNSTFPTTWNPGLAAHVIVVDGLLQATWDESSHPDVDGYLLTVRGESVLRQGQETVVEVNVPPLRNGSGRVAATVDDIEPGKRYRLTIAAIDEQGARSVTSPELLVTTPQPDFVLTGPATNPIVPAGGAPQIVALGLESSSNLPYVPLLFVDYDRLPDGIYVEFLDGAPARRPAATIRMRLWAAAGLPPGHYVVPIVARSGELERTLNLAVQVTQQSRTIALPLVWRSGAPGGTQSQPVQVGPLPNAIHLPLVWR